MAHPTLTAWASDPRTAAAFEALIAASGREVAEDLHGAGATWEEVRTRLRRGGRTTTAAICDALHLHPDQAAQVQRELEPAVVEIAESAARSRWRELRRCR